VRPVAFRLGTCSPSPAAFRRFRAAFRRSGRPSPAYRNFSLEQKQNAEMNPPSSRLRLISTDYDGTLINSYAEGEIHPDFFTRLQIFRNKGPVTWVINTGRTWENLQNDLIERNVPVWPDWVVLVEREICIVDGRRIVSWLEWNHRCELLHTQLFASVRPVWKKIEDFIKSETEAELIVDIGSPLGIIARSEEEADYISTYIVPLLEPWPNLVAVRNSVYFRFSHAFYHKGSCLKAIQQELNISPRETFAVGDHLNDLPMLDRAYAAHIACPANAVELVKAKVRQEGGYVALKDEAAGVIEAWDTFFPKPVE
jgi:hypothetical protein